MDLWLSLPALLLFTSYGNFVMATDTIFVTDEDVTNGGIWNGAVNIPTLNLGLAPITRSATTSIVGVDYDAANNKIYWTEVDDGNTYAGSLKTYDTATSMQSILVSALNLPGDVALDLTTGQEAMYWVHNDIHGTHTRGMIDSRIETSDLTGASPVPIITGLALTLDIAVDPLTSYIFWADLENAVIERAMTDGTNRMSLVSSNINWPSGITLDFSDPVERLYWCDQGLRKLESVKLDGTDRQDLYQYGMSVPALPFGIGIYGPLVYWGDQAWTTLFRINKYTRVEPESVEIAPGTTLTSSLVIHIHRDNPEDTRCTLTCCGIPAPNSPPESLRIDPSFGSMLGGDILTITGMCGPLTSPAIRCKFDTIIVIGNYVSMANSIRCVTPLMYQIGRIPLDISIDGGSTYPYKAFFTMVSVERITPGVTRVNTEWTTSTGNMITWNDYGKFLGTVTNVNVALYGYSETSSVVQMNVRWTYGLPTAVMFSNGPLQIDILFPPTISDRVGIIKVYDSNPEDPLNPAALWSDVHSLDWISPRSSVWCTSHLSGNWISIETNLGGSTFLTNTPACPCDLNQALVDFGRFHPHPKCNMADNNCAGLYADAVHCVRATMPSASGGGQECCYDTDEDIINLNDPALMSGGFAHRNHHAGVPPYNNPQKVPYLSHYLNDLEPRLHCCGATICNSEYETRRPSSADCQAYTPPTTGAGGGDPHLATLDGNSYTFNGKGEYVMLKADPVSGMDSFILQARTKTLPNSDFPITVFVAVVAQYGSSDIVHVELNSRRFLDVWVREQGQEDWSKLSFEQNKWWSLKGVSVSGLNIAETGVLVLFDGGVSLQLRTTIGTSRVMSVLFLGPESFKGHTEGLLGTWNDNPDDDLLTPSGTIVPSDSSTEDIHYQFGQTWQIEAADSLFYYAPLYGPSSYKDEAFVPVFSPPNNPNVVPDDVIAACDGNEWCIFDFQATGDMEVALASKASLEEQEAIIEASMNIIICNSLVAPANGGLYFTRTSVGGVVTYTCDEGFMLMGMEQRVCQENGQWFGRIPTCTEIPVIGPSMFLLDQSVYLVLENGNYIIITIRRSGDRRVAGSVTLTTQSTSEGGALSTTDFQTHTEVIQFNEGVGEIDRFIYIKDDDVREELESFDIRLSDPVNSDIGMPDMATVFIEDDEVEHFFREIAYTVSENTKSVRLTVQKVGYLGRTTVNYITMDDTAKAPEDYISNRGTLTFEPDMINAYIEVSIRNDDLYEEPEQFSVILQSSSPEDVGTRNSAVVNIENEDELCSVPCENDGECTDVDTCTCSSPAFYGRYCEKDSCLPACENGGKCTAFSVCDCAEGYQGNRCQFPICIPSCENGGTCVTPNVCTCLPNYTGSTCTQTVCSPPCLNRGVCNEFHTCTCPFMFTGDHCELLATNDCLTPNLCGSEEFQCIETMDSYRCRCANGYYTVNDQCLLASRIIVIEITVLSINQMALMYHSPLMYPGSREYKMLEEIFVKTLSDLLRFAVTGFLEVKIRAITMGSIRVEFEILLNQQTTTGSQDVLDALQRSTTPRGILTGTNIKVDPFFTTIIAELCPAEYCNDNKECRPDPVNSASICLCDDVLSDKDCSQSISEEDKDNSGDDISVAGIVGLGIVLIVLLVAIPVGILYCHRVRRSRQLNAQAFSMASTFVYQPNQQPNIYWNAGSSHDYTPQRTSYWWRTYQWGNDL
ncbi:uncharacterized protein [Amphiura filiformis]